jgi:GxxExxY protein
MHATRNTPQMHADVRRWEKENEMTPEELNQLSEKVIGCAFKVLNTLGAGFLEKVYENALCHELRKAGLLVDQQRKIEVYYDGILVGYYVADLFVENNLILELKTVKAFEDAHLATTINYLKATKLHLALLLNFAKPRLEIKRVVNEF